jgi:septum formation topological specificity factor MinE
LPADYELLLTKERFEYIEPAYLEALKESLKIIAVIGKLSFDQSCIDIARQAQGQYVIFVHKPTSRQEISESMQQIKDSGKNITVGRGGKYIIVHRQTFLKSKGFDDLLSKTEQLVRL